MSPPYIDTDVIVRLLTGDDPQKQAAARTLFERVERGELTVIVPHTVIADAVFVLSSPRLYALARGDIADMLRTLVALPGFRTPNRRAVMTALHHFGDHQGLDFGDALLIGLMLEDSPATVYSYDRDYDRFPGITRREPESPSRPDIRS